MKFKITLFIFFLGLLPLYAASSKEVCALGSCVTNTSYTRIGIYGAYADTDLKTTQNMLQLSIADRSTTGHNGREIMQVAFGLKAGGIKRNNARFGDFDKRNTTAFAANGRGAIGINLLPSIQPLFLNAVYTLEYISDTLTLHHIGAELEGFIHTNSRLRYEYAFGYDYIFAGNYALPEIPRTKIAGYNYAIRANLGFSYQLNQNLHYFLKIYGKFQNLDNSAPLIINTQDTYLSARKQYFAGVELGIGF